MYKSLGVLLAMATALAGHGAPAWAAEGRPMAVTFDKAQVVHLSAPAHRVIVGNPAIADVSLETPTMMYVFGRTPGETSLTVLGDDDRAILSTSIMVTTEGQRAVSVYSPGAEGPMVRAYSCLSNRCVRVGSPETGNGSAPPAQPVAASSAGDAGAGTLVPAANTPQGGAASAGAATPPAQR